MDIRLTHDSIFGEHLYRLYVDGELYTKFWAKPALTWSQESDTVQTYREALEYWRD